MTAVLASLRQECLVSRLGTKGARPPSVKNVRGRTITKKNNKNKKYKKNKDKDKDKEKKKVQEQDK